MCWRPRFLTSVSAAIASTFLTLSACRADPVLFLVAERPGEEIHLDSYILPLTSPDDISHARRLVSEGPGIGEAIAVSQIAVGADGVNRDLLSPGEPPWSWHVTGFSGFSDFTIEILDGWPAFVEQDVDGWIQNTGGLIGFWNYTVVAEIPPTADLQPGDADQDHDFDQFDLVMVQQAGKYLTGLPATWGEGDWDAAPGRTVGNPPPGNGLFDQADIVSALSAGVYLTGPHAALSPGGHARDGRTSVGYDTITGEVWVDVPAGIQLSSIEIHSESTIFNPDLPHCFSDICPDLDEGSLFRAAFGSGFETFTWGNIAPPGLSEDFLLGDFSAVAIDVSGERISDVDLIYVPEPASIVLGIISLATLIAFPVRFFGPVVL